MIPEAPLQRVGHGLEPAGAGWFVLNARDARWRDGEMGAYTMFNGEGDGRFSQLGFNIGVLRPGEANSMYHGEDTQEDFLVLSGECILVIEGQERRLKAWDFVHCPPWTKHVLIGAGDRPCVVVAVGARPTTAVVYAEDELARGYGAAVERETTSGREAYSGFAEDREAELRDEWLP